MFYTLLRKRETAKVAIQERRDQNEKQKSNCINCSVAYC
jgi:hypothetical protein